MYILCNYLQTDLVALTIGNVITNTPSPETLLSKHTYLLLTITTNRNAMPSMNTDDI